MRPMAPLALRSLCRTQLELSTTSPRVCRQCLPRMTPRQPMRCYSAMSAKLPKPTEDKPAYLTTPIFYVNAAPHIGHLYTMIVTDVFKRWEQLKGKETYMCTGTDEHGMKIQRAALREEVPTKEFCDENSQKFRDLAASADISHDFFIRTTDQDHKEAVSQFYLLLKNAAPEGLGIYKGAHEGWYSVSDECFYAEKEVQTSIVPQTGRKIMASIETGSEVEWVKEDTWFFPLSKYKQKLLDFYDANPDWITPKSRQNEVRDWVKNSLEDLSITRPASRLDWGIRDPEDPSQTIYVWVDALINYLTKAGYGSAWHSSTDKMGIWPADLHVVGKDIIRFHAVYWPALLMALNLPLPQKILCHNHWTMSGRKMSKSVGNVVSPVIALQRWGIDPLRYFLMRNGQFHKDMDYGNDLIGPIVKKELQNNIGNLLNRLTKPAHGRWGAEQAVAAFNAGKFASKGEHDLSLNTLLGFIQETPGKFEAAMNGYDSNEAINLVFELLREANRFITMREPWSLVNTANVGTDQPIVSDPVKLDETIFYACEALRISAILLKPIMPTKMAELLDDLGVKQHRRMFEHAKLEADTDYGVLPAKHLAESGRPKKVKGEGALFPPTVATLTTTEEFVSASEGRK